MIFNNFQRVYASPTSCFKIVQNPAHVQKSTRTQPKQAGHLPPAVRLHCLRKGSCLGNSFHSNVFYVRYAEETVSDQMQLILQVDFQDMVTFHTEVEGEAEFTLKAELMFMEASEEDIRMPALAVGSQSQLLQLGSINGSTQRSGEIVHMPPQMRHPFENDEFINSRFRCVSTRTFKMNNIYAMLGSSNQNIKSSLQYLRIPFDQVHYSCLNLCVQSSLVGFKYRGQSVKT